MVKPSNESLPPARFTLGVSPNVPEEFELWRWAVSPMFDMDALVPTDRSTFSLRSEADHFAGMAMSTTRSSATRFSRSARVVAKSGIDSILFQVYTSGDYALDVEGRSSEVRAGDIAIFDLSRQCDIAAQSYANLSVVLPRTLVDPLVKSMDNIHGLVLTNGTPLNKVLRSHMRMLQTEARYLPEAARASVTQATASLLAACAGPTVDTRDAAAKALAAASLRTMRRSIDANLGNPALGPDTLSREFHISRASLYRVFEPLGGVRKYIQQRRLMRIHADLFDPAYFNQRIHAIAQRWGYTNHATFCRAFRDIYDMAPSDVRAFAHQGYQDAIRADDANNGSFWALNRWLFGLDTRIRD